VPPLRIFVVVVETAKMRQNIFTYNCWVRLTYKKFLKIWIWSEKWTCPICTVYSRQRWCWFNSYCWKSAFL